MGQARKSLWIETFPNALNDDSISVRLVRACGSKRSCSDPDMLSHLVRLVRACGSKPGLPSLSAIPCMGQARKSLWIETKGVIDEKTLRKRSGS